MSLIDKLAKYMMMLIDNNVLTELNYTSSDFIDIISHQFILDNEHKEYDENEIRQILTCLTIEHYKPIQRVRDNDAKSVFNKGLVVTKEVPSAVEVLKKSNQ